MSTSFTRRHFLGNLAGLAAGSVLAPSVWAAPRQTLLVLTNHNDDTFSLFEEAFEKAQSRYRIKLRWAMPPDAMKILRRKEDDSPDVWWQAAPHNHLADLAKEGFLQPLSIDTAGLPAVIGSQPLVGKDDLYRATQLTAFSFLANSQAIKAQGLPWPSDWPVLALPAWAGKITLADPAKQRFGNLLLEVALQAQGWEKGWVTSCALPASRWKACH